MSDFLFRGIGFLFMGIIIAGFVLLFDGVVQLAARDKTGRWKEGGASLLAGALIAGVSAFRVWLTRMWVGVAGMQFLMVGLVLLFNGVVQFCVRKKTGPWKEGGATLLTGALIVGVSVFVGWLTGMLLTEMWSAGTAIWWCFLIAGLVLAVNGVVQFCVRKKTGPWKEGGASLLAGAIIVFLACLAGIKGVVVWFLFMGFIIAGLLLAVNGVVQLRVRKKTGPWKEGRATLLAGAIIVGVCFVLMVVGSLTSPV